MSGRGANNFFAASDYGSYNGTTIRKHLPVHDVTTGSLLELFGHNAIDIALDSGTPLYR